LGKRRGNVNLTKKTSGWSGGGIHIVKKERKKEECLRKKRKEQRPVYPEGEISIGT